MKDITDISACLLTERCISKYGRLWQYIYCPVKNKNINNTGVRYI